MVPLIDLSRRYATFSDEFRHATDEILRSGAILLGERTEALETEFASHVGVAHAVAVSSGASAIQLALAALGIGPSDEVIVPAMTAVPTASAVCAVGATPVFADIDPATAAICHEDVERVVSARTAAIIGVHLYGRPLRNSGELLEFGVPLVEDSAQSHGATRALAGAVGAYSFYPTKNLGGVGDGGMVVTDDPDVAERVRRLRVHGQSAKHEHIDLSQNHRMSELEAAWLTIQLRHLGAGNARRRRIAQRYREAAPSLDWQSDDRDHVHHLAVFRTPAREDTRQRMLAMDVETGVHYPRALTEQPALSRFVTRSCPNAERWAAECVSVPCFPELTYIEVDKVASALSAVGG